MKGRKFSIPGLKLGPSKADTKAVRDHLAVPFDSPPPTPKSVRPPLSPLAEVELRAACAYVLQNFKPSHIVYEEQYGGSGSSNQKQQLDYAAIRTSAPGPPKQSALSPPSLSRKKTQEEVVTLKEQEDGEPARSEKFRYKPAMPVEELFQGEVDSRSQRRKSAIMRAEILMATQPANSNTLGTRDRSESHLRSVSSPMPTALPPKTDLAQRPLTVPRTDSLETTGSTPQTDTTEDQWSDKGSTGMTSAAVTPARGSKRTSQALQPTMETGNLPTPEFANGDWMRQELEKHKQAQEERRQQETVEYESKANGTADTTPTQTSTHTATPVAVRMPTRKPVPHSRTASGQQSRSDSAQEARASPQVRSPTRKAVEAQTQETIEETKPAVETPPVPVRQAPERPSRAPSRARSVSRRVKDYVRSASTHRTAKAEDASRPPSRSGNVTRQVKDYFRPSMDAGSRKQSTDVAREGARSASIDSFHTSTSEIHTSGDASAKQWRTWKPFHRRDRSQTDPYGNASRPGTSGSATEGRGRAANRDADDQTHSKRPVNLNRDLPPLPGLDQWKSNEAEPEEPERDTSANKSAKPIMSPRSHRSQRSRHDRPTVKSIEPELGERDEILAARMGSPRASAEKPATYKPTGAPPAPTGPPPAPPVMMSANFSSPDDFSYEYLSPTASIPEIKTSPAETKAGRRRSKTAQATLPSDHHAEQMPAERLAFTAKAQLMNYSRIAAAPLKGALSRKPSRAGNAGPPLARPPVNHSRKPSASYSGKSSNVDAGRESNDSYQNGVQLSRTPSSAAPAVQPVGDKAKGKWWKRGNNGKPGSWMDQVVKSGSRSGVMVADDVADAPFVRY
ncbi:hypothetical protein LTR15_002574 [Elasticomyces elasticus]|nr:hypothetical protein LTR15_002574 [Elasticomyces elasticus]